MDACDVLKGMFIRMLIANQRRSTPTRRQDVRTALKIRSGDIPPLVAAAQEHLSRLGLELIGVDAEGAADPAIAERLFLRRLQTGPSLPTTEFKRLVLVFTFIILEQMAPETSRLWFLLNRAGVFEDENEFSSFLRHAKTQGYLVLTKVEESPVVMLGWRFHCDFCGFNPKTHLQNTQ